MMFKSIPWFTTAAAALGGIAAYLWGPWDPLCATLVAFVALDYITGVAKAAVLKQLDSGTGFRGLLRKLFIFALVAVATMADRIIPEAHGAIRAAVMVFYIANEGLSILENAAQLGLPMPEALKTALKKLGSAPEAAKKEQEENKNNGHGA